MGISDKIEAFITELLKEEADDEWLELKRNELAAVFGCVPSQINYVISTRFNTERGYIVESRRGGGGYLRIKRVCSDEEPVLQTIKSIGQSLDFPTAKSYVDKLTLERLLSDDSAKLILAAISDNSLTTGQPEKDKIRANILKNMLAAII